MLETRETDSVLEILDRMPVGQRMLFGCLALLPLLAPYELLVMPEWASLAGLEFALFAGLSLVAVGISAFLAFAAVAGLDGRVRLDIARGEIRAVRWAPIVWRRARRVSLDHAVAVVIRPKQWADGGRIWGLWLDLDGVRPVRLGSGYVRADMESLGKQVAAFLGVRFVESREDGVDLGRFA